MPGPLEAIGLTDVVQIGAGGSSIVYRARQVAFDRLVALKVLTTPPADDKGRRRFERELALAGRLSGHPNVVTVFGSGFLPDGRGYVVMEHAAGGSLADRLDSNGPFPVSEVVAIGIKMAGVLELAARDGVVHRDVKPANILVTRFGEPALSDFGIAVVAGEVTGTTQSLTPLHAAPEVLEGGSVGPPADQWSLASTLHTLLAGRAPFAGTEGGGLLAGMLRVLNDPVPAIPRPDVPPALVDALGRALSKDAAARWPSPADLGRALQAVEVEAGWTATLLPIVEVGVPGPPPRGETPSHPSGTTLGGSIWPLREDLPAPAGGPAGDTQHFRRGIGGAPAPAPVAQPAPAAPAPAAPPPAPVAQPAPADPPPALVSPVGLAGEWEATRHFRRRPPESPPEPIEAPTRSNLRVWIGVGVAAAALVVVAVVVVVATAGGGAPRPKVAHGPVLQPVSTDPSALQPRNVRVIAEQPTTVTLSWTEPPGVVYPHVVEVSGISGIQVATGPTQTVIQKLQSAKGYCFTVGTVYTVGGPPAYAPPVCIRGGTVTATTLPASAARTPVVTSAPTAP